MYGLQAPNDYNLKSTLFNHKLYTKQKKLFLVPKDPADNKNAIVEIRAGTGGTDVSNVEKAEGYLAWKWGLQSNLPISHPYKNAAPTV